MPPPRASFCPANSRAPRDSGHGFTLIELLVVISIIAILLVAVLPAVNSLSKSSGRKGAVSNLLGAIEQARAEAIKSGQATYVVFPVFAANTSAATLDRYHYKAYAIFEDDPAHATPKQLTTWKVLPTGISLRADQSSNQSLANLTAADALNPKEAFVFAPDTNASTVFYCIKFNSNGEVESPTPVTGSTILLGIFEGQVIGSTENSTSKPIVTETISLSPLTGRAEHS